MHFLFRGPRTEAIQAGNWPIRAWPRLHGVPTGRYYCAMGEAEGRRYASLAQDKAGDR